MHVYFLKIGMRFFPCRTSIECDLHCGYGACTCVMDKNNPRPTELQTI